MDQAVNDCIHEEVLADILSVHKAEVIAMFLTEYDEERHLEMEREEWEAKGEIKGLIETCQELGVSRSSTGERLQAKLSLDADAAEEYLKKYWK